MHASLKSFKPLYPTGKTARRLTAALCLCSALSSIVAYWACDSLPTVLMLLDLTTLASMWWLHRDSRNAITLQPKELAARMIEVQESERQHLSRELHDDIGQLLTAATLQTRWLQRRAPEDLQAHCLSLCALLEETLAKVRDVSAAFNPTQIASLGLDVSLRAHLMKTLENASLRWTFECHPRLGDIQEDMAVVIFRVTQESVTNVLRHARASNLLVQLRRQADGLHLSVRDDGVGFVPASDPRQAGQRGMAGMLERVEQLNGSISVISEPGAGTHTEVLLPWPRRTHPRAQLGQTS